VLRSSHRLSSRRRLGLAAVVAATFAFAWPMQGGGSLQNAHYVLAKALASGTASIDRTLGTVDSGTNDTMLHDGRLYSNKAPGLALAAVPAYGTLRGAGVEASGEPTRMLWALGLVLVVLPAAAVVALGRTLADRVAPGFGTVAAVTVGLGTLVLPFATLFLSNLLSAVLVFAAFAVLWLEREGRPSPRVAAGAGLMVGLSVVVEYQNAVAAGILGLYALARSPRLRRAGAYAAAVLVGVLPLLAYNQWAFGSAFHSSYAADASGQTSSLFDAPNLDVLLEFFLSQHGLLVISPVVACALAGLPLLARRGHGAEALVIGGMTLGYALFSSAFYSPFGGFSPGPRYLVVVLPFLAVPLALVFRAAPLVTGALALVSATSMAMLTASHPLAGYDGRWADRLADGDVPLTAASLVGVTGWYAIAPFFAAVVLAGWLALAATEPTRVGRRETALAGAMVLAWAALAALMPPGDGEVTREAYALLAVVLAGVLAWLLGAWQRPHGRLRETAAVR
jgi:hypothetical protein